MIQKNTLRSREAGIAGLFLLLLICPLIGCSQGNPPVIVPKQEVQQGPPGIIEGTVYFIGVPCPEDRMKVPPCDGPYPDYEVVLYREGSGDSALKTRSDRHGMYSLSVPAGRYFRRSAGEAASPGFSKESGQVITVEAGKTVVFDVRVDRGIR